MNNQSPLVPQGSVLEQKNKGRTRVKIAVFFVLTIHGIGLMALLLQGCRRDEPTQKGEQAASSSALPTIESQAQVADPAATSNTTPATAGTTPTPTPGTPESPGAPSTIGGTDYAIAKGDTFSSIATHFHVTTKAIVDANPGVDANRLQIGKKIHIPAQPIPGATTAATGTTVPEPANGEKLYTVKSGDTLSTIAKSHSSTVKAIRAANSLGTDRIIVGQKLKIPVKPVETAATAPSSPTPSR
jgi:LysM repeat protein